ncbi:4a-hydroxytetrahydrobiopterin dehydratase [Leptospira sp. WS39.C2]
MKENNQVLSETVIQTLVDTYPGWTYYKETEISYLSFDCQFSSFQSAFLFLTKLAFVSETLDHHAEIWNLYKHVKLKLYTHTSNLITEKDSKFVNLLMSKD